MRGAHQNLRSIAHGGYVNIRGSSWFSFGSPLVLFFSLLHKLLLWLLYSSYDEVLCYYNHIFYIILLFLYYFFFSFLIGFWNHRMSLTLPGAQLMCYLHTETLTATCLGDPVRTQGILSRFLFFHWCFLQGVVSCCFLVLSIVSCCFLGSHRSPSFVEPPLFAWPPLRITMFLSMPSSEARASRKADRKGWSTGEAAPDSDIEARDFRDFW